MSKKRTAQDGPRAAKGPGLVEQLQQAIRQSGETLTVLAKRTGIGADRLSRLVRGERGISLAAADTLCRALGLRLAGGPSGAAQEGRTTEGPAGEPSGQKRAPRGKRSKGKGVS